MKQKLLTLTELCKELSISYATGRNWLRLGKISPSKTTGETVLFAPSYVESLKKDITTGNNTSLKSRRNKKYKTGFDLYESYVNKSSKNLQTVSDIVLYIKENGIDTDEKLLRALVSECALKLLCMKRYGSAPSICLRDYYEGKLEIHCRELIDDIITEPSKAMDLLDHYHELFSMKYTYIPTEDTLGLLYISLNNLWKRKALGAYYTPTEVVNRLCNNLFSNNDYQKKTVLDPCCGTGNFLLQLPRDIDHRIVYGNDIDEISVRIARLNYALKYNVYDRDTIYDHITQADFLTDGREKKYDYIIGNPPWGSKSPFDCFVEKALEKLAANGHLSFVLPEAILSVRSHMDIRKRMLSCCSFEYVEYLGEVFHGVQCPSVILDVKLTNKPFSSKGLVVQDGERRFEIKTDHPVSPKSLSFRMTDEEYNIIQRIESLENKVTLKNNAIFALGIVTGDNKRFISDKKSDENEPVLKGADIEKYSYRKPENYILFRPRMLQQVAPIDIYRAKEKLLYKFISKELVFAYDNTGVLSLNSCNVLIPRIPGLDIKYVMAVLNSGVAQFYYSKVFGSVKVLRSHLEQIPIPVADENAQKKVIALVDRIMETDDEKQKTELKAKLENEITALYSCGVQVEGAETVNGNQKAQKL